MRFKVFLAIILAGAVMGGSAQENTVFACVAADGSVRIVATSGACAAGETPREWAVAGPTGPAGPAGPQGEPGSSAMVPNVEVIGTLYITDTTGFAMSAPILGLTARMLANRDTTSALDGEFTVQVPLDHGIDLVRLSQLTRALTATTDQGVVLSLNSSDGAQVYTTFAVSPAKVSAAGVLADDGRRGERTLVEIKLHGLTRQLSP